MKELQIDFEYPGFLKPKTSRPMHKMLEQAFKTGVRVLWVTPLPVPGGA